MSEAARIGTKAQTANPALEPLAFLIGNWRTTGSHPMVPGKALRGRTSFAWHEGGAFLIVRSEVYEPKFPDGVAIIGSDDAGKLSMIYFDERGVSRILDVSFSGQTVTWRHNDPKFAQSTSIAAEDDGARLVSQGLMSENGGPWTDDLSQRFEREVD